MSFTFVVHPSARANLEDGPSEPRYAPDGLAQPARTAEEMKEQAGWRPRLSVSFDGSITGRLVAYGGTVLLIVGLGSYMANEAAKVFRARNEKIQELIEGKPLAPRANEQRSAPKPSANRLLRPSTFKLTAASLRARQPALNKARFARPRAR